MTDMWMWYYMWTLAAVITGGGIIALTMWAIAEFDERKWRRRMHEIMSERLDCE